MVQRYIDLSIKTQSHLFEAPDMLKVIGDPASRRGHGSASKDGWMTFLFEFLRKDTFGHKPCKPRPEASVSVCCRLSHGPSLFLRMQSVSRFLAFSLLFISRTGQISVRFKFRMGLPSRQTNIKCQTNQADQMRLHDGLKTMRPKRLHGASKES